MPPGTQIGGIHILPDRIIQIYGDIQASFSLNAPIIIHKFTILRFHFNVRRASDQFRVCLYESASKVDTEVIVGDEYRCTQVSTPGNIEIKIGEFFDDRMTEINTIRFDQINIRNPQFGDSEVGNIGFESGEKIPIFNKDGNCNDMKAFNTTVDGKRKCICKDTFIASNGGKVLGEYDSCVKCLGRALDGEGCSQNRDCVMGTCIESVCIPGVSYLPIEKYSCWRS